LAVHNLSEQHQSIELTAHPQGWLDLLSLARLGPHVALPPYQFLWLHSTED